MVCAPPTSRLARVRRQTRREATNRLREKWVTAALGLKSIVIDVHLSEPPKFIRARSESPPACMCVTDTAHGPFPGWPSRFGPLVSTRSACAWVAPHPHRPQRCGALNGTHDTDEPPPLKSRRATIFWRFIFVSGAELTGPHLGGSICGCRGKDDKFSPLSTAPPPRGRWNTTPIHCTKPRL
jgi:hypothetical protein